FSGLPFHTKSAMAETLVSDQCERRPPLLIGGRFHLRHAGGGPKFYGLQVDCTPVVPQPRSQRNVSTRPDPPVSVAVRIVFSIARHCSCAVGFSLAVARPRIVIGAHFPLQIDCIWFAAPLPSPGRGCAEGSR